MLIAGYAQEVSSRHKNRRNRTHVDHIVWHVAPRKIQKSSAIVARSFLTAISPNLAILWAPTDIFPAKQNLATARSLPVDRLIYYIYYMYIYYINLLF